MRVVARGFQNEAQDVLAGAAVSGESVQVRFPLPSHPTPAMKLIRDLLVLGSGILSALYLLNLSFGMLEFIPDTVPIFGNLDEAAATALLINCLAYFGFNVGHLFRRKGGDAKPAPKTHDIDAGP